MSAITPAFRTKEDHWNITVEVSSYCAIAVVNAYILEMYYAGFSVIIFCLLSIHFKKKKK